ncbi:MAG: hypothetical protein R2712_03395 [Vicinamibacterales bacterium]
MEDFAETFAVWLQPRAVAQSAAGNPALLSWKCVDQLMAEIADTTPPVRNRRRVESLPTLNTTIRDTYRRNRAIAARALQRLRPGPAAASFRAIEAPPVERAMVFLHSATADIHAWRAGRGVSVHRGRSHADMIGRCRELKLRAVGPERRLRMDAALMLTVSTMHVLHSHRRWIAL